MALPDEKGRIQSIEVRLSHIVELWVFTKLIEAIDGETLDRWVIEGLTINSPGNNWWIEFMRNEPIAFIKSRRNNEKYTIYYQPSIYRMCFNLVRSTMNYVEGGLGMLCLTS
jgi:hypothetical protein